MERFNVAATKDTPQIILDKVAGTFEIRGRSFPEDAYPVFSKVINWLNPLSESHLVFC